MSGKLQHFESWSESVGGRYDNFPTAYDEVPNAIEPDQAVLSLSASRTLCKPIISMGDFRFSGLWGLDYSFHHGERIFQPAVAGASSVTRSTWSVGDWIRTGVLLGSEVRYERSYDNPAYQNGTKKNQLTAAGDIIFFFLRDFSLN
jgi:hypothetical protein